MGTHLQDPATPGGTLIKGPPVEHTRENLCDTLQDALLDIVRQLLGQPVLTADQLQLVQLLVTAGGLGLPRLPTLALVARSSCKTTLPREMTRNHSERNLSDEKAPSQMGSASDT